MIAIDTNILVYAYRQDSPWHKSSYSAIKGLAEGLKPWLIVWPCLHEFVAIVTHPKIYDPPSKLSEAFDQIDAWMESPSLTVASEGDAYLINFKKVTLDARAAGPVVHDAHIAALCLEYDVDELWSADRDFSRFPDLKIRNPLKTAK